MKDLDRLASELRDFYQRSHRVADRMMGAEGVSLVRFKLLTFIERSAPVRSVDLATEFNYSPRTVTEAIDALERDGLVIRRPDPGDRRAKHVIITPAGRAALQASEAPRQRFLQEIFGILSDGQRETLADILNSMNARLQELDACSPSNGRSQDRTPGNVDARS